MVRDTSLLYSVVGVFLLCAAPAAADFKLERHLPLNPGGTFTLQSDVGSVTLVGDAATGASITLRSRRDDFDDRYDIEFDQAARSVTVTVKRRGTRLFNLFGDFRDDVRFAIHVPRQTAVTLQTSGGSIDVTGVAGHTRVDSSGGALRTEDIDGPLHAHTSGGSIRVLHVRGDAVLDTSGGSITVLDVEGTLSADTSGGRIDVDDVRGEILARTSGGAVRVRGAAGRVVAHTSGGPVTVGFAAGNGRGGDLSSSGGSVRVEVDPSVPLSIDASSSGGGVTADIPVSVSGRISNRSLRGTLNGGGPTLRLRSSGGGVRIASAEAASR